MRESFFVLLWADSHMRVRFPREGGWAGRDSLA